MFIYYALAKYRFFHFRRHHPYINIQYQSAEAVGNHSLERASLVRLIKSIKNDVEIVPTGADWSYYFNEYHSEAMAAIKNEQYDDLENMLSHPLNNNLMYGFDNLAKSLRSPFRLETRSESLIAADHFLALAEYLSIVKYISPEDSIFPKKKVIHIEMVINKIVEDVFEGESFIFPNPYECEKGIWTKFGIASLRVPASIYQALRVSRYGSNICEIGPGLGRTAYFATVLGAKKYTLVDIPISSMVQGYFLLNSLPKQRFIFNGEPELDHGLHFRSPDSFFDSKETYDLVLNVDALTEIGIEVARRYLQQISQRTQYFLSINHEGNEFTIRELVKEFPELRLVERSRSWIRPGYVEELYKIER